MKRNLLKTMLIALFLLATVVVWGQTIFYQETFDTNVGWTLDSNWSIESGYLRLYWSPSVTNYDLSATSPVISIPANAGDMVVTMYFNNYSTQGDPPETLEIGVLVGGTPTVLWTYNLNEDWGVDGGTDLTLSLAAFAGQNVQLRFRSYGATTFNINWWDIYEIKAYASLSHDLAAVSLTGSTTPTVGAQSNYTLTVRNGGQTAVTPADYTVQLMKEGDIQIATLPGVALTQGQTAEFVLPWTPAVVEATYLYGKVTYAADVYPGNNQTANLNVNVQPSGTVLVEIGTGTSPQDYPFYVWWDYTRSASLYTFPEINLGGVVTGVKWYCSSTGTVFPNIPYKIYLKNVTENVMTAGAWSSMIDGASLMLDNSYVFNTTGWHTFSFTTPFVYTGGSLLVLVEANIGAYLSGGPQFYYTAGTAGTHQYWYQDGSPPAGNGTLNANRPNIGLYFITAGLGHVSGTVSSGATPIAGALLTVDDAPQTATSAPDGTYSIQYLTEGVHNITCTKVGYYPQTLPVTIVENQTSTLNFNMVAQPQVTVTGLVVGSDAPTVGLANAEVTLMGVLDYTATTNATGNFTIPNVLAGNTYNYSITRFSYQTATGSVTLGTTDYNMGTIILNEIALPAGGVQAEEVPPNVNLIWRTPGTAGGEWIQWDSDENTDSIGLTSGGTFDIASRWPTDQLTDFVGMSLHAIKFWPGDAATYRMRVWTGGSLTGPAQMVYDEPLSTYTVDAFNTYILTSPVAIQAGQELWFGYNVTHTAGTYPAGCDPGPAHNGLGNMIFNDGVWTTLYALAPTLNYDWNLAAYVGYSAPDAPVQLTQLRSRSAEIVSDSKSLFGIKSYSVAVRSTPTTVSRTSASSYDSRALMGYKVWRMLQGQESNEAAWALLTPTAVVDTSYIDTTWSTIPEGDYKWAVKAVYTNDVLAPAAFSNMVMKRPNDLSALSITGSTTPSVGLLSNYAINIRNTGTAPQTAGSYTVKIMSGTTELGSAPGPAILPGQFLDVIVGWTPTTQGTTMIYGKVVLPTDTLPTNDETPPLEVLVYPSGTLLVEIGDGTATQRQPFGIYYDYERDAALYTQAEIGAYGAVTALKWYCATTSVHAVPYKIYLKTTTDTALPAVNWASMIADAQLMHDATLTFSQEGWVTFNFTTPFIYTTGNLMVLVETNIVNYQTNYPFFRYTTAPAGHHLVWYQDGSVPAGNGTANTNRPNIGIFLATAGLGHVGGTVTSGTTPIGGALLTVDNTSYSGTSNAAGAYTIQYIPEGPQNVTCYKVGYNTQTLPVIIVENQTATLNFNLVSLPQVSVTGMVVGSDAPTVGIAGADVVLTGMVDYNATTNAAGQFTIPNVYASQMYNYTITKAGYSPASGTINIGMTDFNMGTITINEIAYPPTGVQAAEAAPNVNITWTAPDPNVQEITESFEGDTFPPEDWSQVITDTGPANTVGVFPTWCRVPAYTPSGEDPVTPPDGDWQVSMWWSYSHQDEWLITPQFECPFDASLMFNGYIFLGSTHDDHYYVKVSTDNGSTWTVLWDAVTATPGGDYSNYTVPFDISLSAYAGQQIKLAWHAQDPPSNDGMWNIAAFDNIFIGSPTRTITFGMKEMEIRSKGNTVITSAPIARAGIEYHSKAMALGLEAKTPTSNHNDRIPAARTAVDHQNTRNARSLTGYRVWRLLVGQESNEAAWTILTVNPISATAYQDMGWATVPDGTYKWAVKAVYTGDVLSTSSLSNAIQKITQIGTIAGLVRNTSNQPIAGATVTAGTYTTTTNTTGAYSLQVPAGTHTVTCSADGYATSTQTGIVVVTGQTTPVNFILSVSNLVTDGFEPYDNFALNFPPWVCVDIDQAPTYTITGVTFPGGGDPMAYIIFVPSATTPPLTTAAWLPHGGDKYAACFAATTPPNNDWLISQLFENIGEGASVGFWAKSVTAAYGLERFKVGVSEGGTAPANFTFISGATHIEAPIDWTWFEYDIPVSYEGQDIRVGIQCVSNDAFVFMVDDFVMDLGSTSNVDPVTPVVTTALNGNFPNPFNPETTISYSVKGTAPITVEIYNLKGQKVRTLVNETKAEGHYQVKWDGTDNNNQSVTSGVYFYKMNAGKYTSTRKMILMK